PLPMQRPATFKSGTPSWRPKRLASASSRKWDLGISRSAGCAPGCWSVRRGSIPSGVSDQRPAHLNRISPVPPGLLSVSAVVDVRTTENVSWRYRLLLIEDLAGIQHGGGIDFSGVHQVRDAAQGSEEIFALAFRQREQAFNESFLKRSG